MIDAHCHLNDLRFGDELPALLDRMTAAGVTAALVVGTDLDSSRRAVALARTYPNRLRAAVGLHPHDSTDLDDATADALAALAREPEVVAWGEIGLDYHYDHSPRDVQRAAFRRQLGLAREAGLPLILHEREAEDDLCAILDAADGWALGGTWHCCSVGPESGARIAQRLYIGIAGWLTFPKSDNIRALAAAVPLDRLLLETDAPYITPVPCRGKRNEPSYLPYTAQMLAEVKKIAQEDVEHTTAENVRRAFPRWRP
jgi:TatD DNase family protein